MKQGIFLKNEEGCFYIEEIGYCEEGTTVSIFDEDDQEWLDGKVQKDEFGEYYFTNGFLVVYLYEGLPVRIK